MAQATQHNSSVRNDFYLVDETQFVRLALFRKALTGIARIAEGANLHQGGQSMEVTRDELAAVFEVLGNQLDSIAGNLPLKG